MKSNYVGTIHKIKVLTTYPESAFLCKLKKRLSAALFLKKNWQMNYSCYLMAQN